MVDFFFFKQKTAYEIRKGDWSSDVCSSDLVGAPALQERRCGAERSPGERELCAQGRRQAVERSYQGREEPRPRGGERVGARGEVQPRVTAGGVHGADQARVQVPQRIGAAPPAPPASPTVPRPGERKGLPFAV